MSKNKVKEVGSMGYASPGAPVVEPEILKNLIDKEGTEIYMSRQARLSNGAEKVSLTLYFWPGDKGDGSCSGK